MKIEDIFFPEGEELVRLDSFYVVPLDQLNHDSYKVIEKRSTYAIVESEVPVGDESLAVVAVKGSRHLGVVTGVLKVHLQHFTQRDLVLDGFHYEISQEYEHLSRVLYKLDNYEQAQIAFSKLSSDPRVISAELEVLQFERGER